MTKQGKELEAKVISANEKVDVALLEVSDKGLHPCPVANSDLASVGDEVFAIGAPSGDALSFSVTKGIVSSLREGGNGTRYIQTDAAINHGNSGGPLVNSKGEITSLVTWKIVGNGSEGLGFCVAINDALRAARTAFKPR